MQIESSCLIEKESANVFEYIKQIAELCDIRNEENGEKILPNKFKKYLMWVMMLHWQNI